MGPRKNVGLVFREPYKIWLSKSTLDLTNTVKNIELAQGVGDRYFRARFFFQDGNVARCFREKKNLLDKEIKEIRTYVRKLSQKISGVRLCFSTRLHARGR